ncbi:hypothetical protein C1863_00380 [Eggerthella lenta]|nr:hypothetical protein C1863_00380 [Eggerthella lenta]
MDPEGDPSLQSTHDESKVLIPEGAMAVLDAKYLDDGSLCIATSDSEYRNVVVSEYRDGKWETSFTTEQALSSLGDDMDVEAVALSGSGELLCSFTNPEGSRSAFRLIGKDADDEVSLSIERTAIGADPSSENASSLNGVVGMRFLDDGGVYVVESKGTLSKYDIETGNKKFVVEIGQNDGVLADYAVCGDQLVASFAHIDGDRVSFGISAFSADTGKREDLDPSLEKALTSNLVKDASLKQQVSPPLLASSSNGLLLCSDGKMIRYEDGNALELFGKGTNLENTNMSPARLFVKPESDDMLILYASSSASSLYKYEKIDVADDEGASKTEISIYSLEDNPEIMQAVANYREKRQDITINVTVGIPAGSGISSDDAIRSLNAMLLSDDCPDVLVLDGLPVDQLVSQGLLIDLSESRNEILGSDQYFTNVLNAFGETEWYAVPTRFAMPAVVGSTQMVDGFESLAGLVEMLESDDQKKSRFAPASSISAVFAAEYQNIVGSGSVDPDALSDFFLNSKKLLEIAEANLSEDAKANGADPIEYALSGLDRMTGSMGRSETLISGTYQLEIGSIVHPFDFGYLYLATENAPYESSFSPLVLSADQAFVPNTILGVCSKSGNVEASKEFLSFVLSSECQAQNQGMGVPVNKKAFETAIREADGFGLGFLGGDDPKNYTIEPLSESQIENCCNMIFDAQVPVTFDTVTTETIQEEFAKYCNGQASLEQSVSNTVEKVDLYKKQ